MRSHTVNGPGSDCRLRRSGNSHRGVDSTDRSFVGEVKSKDKGVSGGQTRIKGDSQAKTPLKMGMLALHRSRAIPPTAMGSTTPRATSGNGAQTGIPRLTIDRARAIIRKARRPASRVAIQTCRQRCVAVDHTCALTTIAVDIFRALATTIHRTTPRATRAFGASKTRSSSARTNRI